MLTGLLFALWGCGARDETPAPIALVPIEDPQSVCEGATLAEREVNVDLVLHAGTGVSDTEVARAAAVLAGRAESMGLTFSAGMGEAWGADFAMGVPPETGTSPELQLAPLASAVERHLRPMDGRLHLVVVRDVVDPRSRLARVLQLEGFGMTGAQPDLRPAAVQVRAALGSGAFSPFVLLDADLLSNEDRLRSVALHELGHALGLVHVEADDPRRDNAMHPVRRPGCVQTLSRDQLDRLILPTTR